MMTIEKAIDKAQKLLALGTSSNEHEAALALAKAQDIMLEHGLEMHQITGRRPESVDVKETSQQDIFTAGKPDAWKGELFTTIARTSGVWPLMSWRYDDRGRRVRTGWFAGLPGDVELAEYAYSFLVAELLRLAKVEADRGWAAIRDMAADRGISVHDAEARYVWYNSHPLKVKASWLRGAADGVGEQLQRAKRDRDRAAGVRGDELIVNRDQVIRDWWYRKQYGMSYADYTAKWEKQAASVEEAKPKTAAQIRKDQKRAEAAYRRYERSQRAAHNRKWANVDMTAYMDGHRTGQSLSTRPGIKEEV